MDKNNCDFDSAIRAHSRWKFHLKDVIEKGYSNFTITQVADCHACEFGKWLDSKHGKALPGYQEFVKLHQQFHQEAASIMQLALEGEKEKALEKMQLGSHFNQLASELINRLAEVRDLRR